MFGGYQWDGIDFNKINFGGDSPVSVDYGGQHPAAPSQNFDGHDTLGGHGVIDQLLDLNTGGIQQNFGDAGETMDFDLPAADSGTVKISDEPTEDKKAFDNLIEVMDDLYSFEHALKAVPGMRAYFGVDAADNHDSGPPFINVKSFLNPTGLEKADAGGLILGLPDLTLENPPKKVTEHTRHLVITPALLIEAFCAKDSFEPAERYHVRRNIIGCLTALAELQRHRLDIARIDPSHLILSVQQCRLKSSADHEYARDVKSHAMDQTDRTAHVREITRRTLARLQQGAHLKKAAADFEALDLQRPGQHQAVSPASDIMKSGDANHAGKLARLTLDQIADLVVETRPDWRLPFKTALADAAADYIGVEIRDATVDEINATREALLEWAKGRRRNPPDISRVLACIPSLCRQTMLQHDPATKEVREIPLKHAEDLFLPSAVAKALKARMSNLEHQVAGLVKNRNFYSDIYEHGHRLSSSLNLHGMYLQCSNPANLNMAFQTPAQFNHPVYATRCSSGLYINVNQPDHPKLECREGAELRLTYIDKLWSLFRVIVMDALEERLSIRLASDASFLAETDPEKTVVIASEWLDRCVPETFDGAAGNITGITRNILINAAIRNARPDPDTMAP